MKDLHVKISEEDERKIYDEVREELRSSITTDALKEYMRSTQDLDILELIADLGLHAKYEELKNEKVGNLTRNDKLICMLYWMIYERLR